MKCSLMQCENYRILTLMHIMSKFMLTVLLERPRHSIKLFLAEEQAGFRRDRGIQQILMLQLIPEKAT